MPVKSGFVREDTTTGIVYEKAESGMLSPLPEEADDTQQRLSTVGGYVACCILLSRRRLDVRIFPCRQYFVDEGWLEETGYQG